MKFLSRTAGSLNQFMPTPNLPSSSLVVAASHTARAAHQNQTRSDGSPYYFHAEAVAGIAYAASEGKPKREREVIAATAFLHDVLEDTSTREFEIESSLRVQGMAEPHEATRIMEALDLLNHRDGGTYKTYIAMVGANPLAKAVKLADLKHNLADNGGPRKSLASRYYAAQRQLQS